MGCEVKTRFYSNLYISMCQLDFNMSEDFAGLINNYVKLYNVQI
jgi:hypothetical protein